MDPPTRIQMRKAWDFCERHAWGWIAVEAAFRDWYMHGPAILYADLMRRAAALFDIYGPMQNTRVRISLRGWKHCLMCEVGFGPCSRSFAPVELIKRGRDLSRLRSMAQRTRLHWEKAVCGNCAGNGSVARCRKHFLEDPGSAMSLQRQKELVTYIFHHVAKYSCSFCVGFHGTETEEDIAALIMAVGWCSGWGIFLSIMSESCRPEGAFL